MQNQSRAYWGVGIVLTLIVLAVFALRSGSSPTASAATVTDPSGLPGIMTGTLPWPPEFAHLRARLAAIGLPALATEGTALHIHEHIDLFVNSARVPVPAEIGDDDAAGIISPIHTHDDTGIIHVESPRVETFTLGQFFDVWGVRFTENALGGYEARASSMLTVYVNGTRYAGDPRQIPLVAHEEIAVVFGVTPASVPATFAFPDGY